MKRILAAIMLAILIPTGLTTAGEAYSTSIRVTPVTCEGKPCQYLVEFRIMQAGEDGKRDVVMAPKLVVGAGRQGKVAIGDDDNALSCTTVVNETKDGFETTATIAVKREGKEIFTSSQSLVVNK